MNFLETVAVANWETKFSTVIFKKKFSIKMNIWRLRAHSNFCWVFWYQNRHIAFPKILLPILELQKELKNSRLDGSVNIFTLNYKKLACKRTCKRREMTVKITKSSCINPFAASWHKLVHQEISTEIFFCQNSFNCRTTINFAVNVNAFYLTAVTFIWKTFGKVIALDRHSYLFYSILNIESIMKFDLRKFWQMHNFAKYFGKHN